MSTLSVTELRAQVETDLSSTPLQDVVDAVERDISEYIGPATNHVLEFQDVELLNVLDLPKAGALVDSIVESTGSRSNPVETTLSANDHDLSEDAWTIRRLSDGTNPRVTWGWRVVIQIDEVADVSRRKQAAVQLARLLLNHTGFKSERAGDWSGVIDDIRSERARILRSLDQAVE